MSKNLMQNKWVEILIIMLVMALFSLVSIYISPILLLVLPAPFISYNVKTDIKIGMLAFIGLAAILGLILGMSFGLLILIIFGPMILTVSVMIRKEQKLLNIIISGTIIMFISFFIILLIGNSGDVSLSDEVKASIDSIIPMQVDILEESGIFGDDRDEITKMVTKAFNYFVGILPGIMFIMSLIVVYINTLLTIFGLERMNSERDIIPNFSDFKIPSRTFINLLVIIVIMYIMSKMNIEYVDFLKSNVSIIVNFLIFIQGVAVVMSLMEKRNRKLFSKILFIVVMIIMPFITLGVYFLGMLDIVFNFRKIKEEV